MFDISRRSGSDQLDKAILEAPVIGGKSKKVSKSEIEDLLENFVSVPKEEWLSLQKGDFIRYKRKDGNFRKGGFLVTIRRTGKGEGTMRIVFDNSGFMGASKNPSWVVKTQDLQQIWVEKSNTVASRLIDLEKQVMDLQDLVKQQQKAVTEIQTAQSTIVSNIVELQGRVQGL